MANAAGGPECRPSLKQKSRLWCVGTKNGRREYSIQRISIPAFNFSSKSMGTQTFMGLFYFFGIGGTNPAPFDLLKSPSGIPPPIMYKKCRAERNTLPGDNKKAPRPYSPGDPLYCLKMAHHAKNNDKRRGQQKQYNQHIKHPLQLYFTIYPEHPRRTSQEYNNTRHTSVQDLPAPQTGAY